MRAMSRVVVRHAALRPVLSQRSFHFSARLAMASDGSSFDVSIMIYTGSDKSDQRHCEGLGSLLDTLCAALFLLINVFVDIFHLTAGQGQSA
jgi:hypothetical protein